jgi:hypothetical protein
MIDPRKGFSSFLNSVLKTGWITDYEWLNTKGLSCFGVGGVSKTHKLKNGKIFTLIIHFNSDKKIGVDLEFCSPNKSLEKSRWTRHLLGLSPSASIEKIIQEWCIREACFKAAFSQNEGNSEFDLFDFQSTSQLVSLGTRRFTFRTAQFQSWHLCVAKERAAPTLDPS